MKPQTLLRLSLIIPYLLWVLSAIIVMVVSSSKNTAFASSAIINVLLYVPMLYALGIYLWGIPYTLLVIGLWLWSRGKTTQKIIRTFALSPLMLAILISLELLAFSINWNDLGAGFSQNSADFGASVLGLGMLAIVFGYLSIGVVMGIYKVLTLLNFIKNENELTSTQQDALPN